MRIVAGLGNPGPRYRYTRHNAGFRVVDLLAVRARVRQAERADGGGGPGASVRQTVGRLVDHLRRVLHRTVETEAWLAEAMVGGTPVLLVKPLAFMNRSGLPIARVLAARKASPSDLLVVVDDVALELGSVRVRPRGRHGGHNGLRSLITELGTDEFARVRVGVGRGPSGDLADHVLAEPPAEEAERFEQALSRAADAVECVLRDGLSAAMDGFNGGQA